MSPFGCIWCLNSAFEIKNNVAFTTTKAMAHKVWQTQKGILVIEDYVF